jgi:hypothetical protein
MSEEIKTETNTEVFYLPGQTGLQQTKPTDKQRTVAATERLVNQQAKVFDALMPIFTAKDPKLDQELDVRSIQAREKQATALCRIAESLERYVDHVCGNDDIAEELKDLEE